ncbi:sigma factor-like helix-turn-helix DNA-binding protein [Parablautia sp. Marseille-Q6255]|uniref:sigma factor-like helix-turn-helix DNA-binding protein n=1 Tax=Parablautia sp. Marseille-Q6255 TaxID=3039593 RepID=UPI0024BD06FB|nr:sigma factor-like helix-turn-helix DNA-binding protein [Parablautia sp. Marseille-Q6255]
MNVEEKDLLNQFSAYVKASIKYTKSEYLEKRTKIRNSEVILFENEDVNEEGMDDILQQVEKLSENLGQEVLQIQLLLDQISNSKIYRAVSGLNKDQKEILLLRILYLKSFEEISSMLNIKQKKVENTYYNAIKKIRIILGGRNNGI